MEFLVSNKKFWISNCIKMASYKVEENKGNISSDSYHHIFEIKILEVRGNFLGLPLTIINVLVLERKY